VGVVLPKITPFTVYGIEATEKTSANSRGSLQTLQYIRISLALEHGSHHDVGTCVAFSLFSLVAISELMLIEQADLDGQRFPCEFNGVVHAGSKIFLRINCCGGEVVRVRNGM